MCWQDRASGCSGCTSEFALFQYPFVLDLTRRHCLASPHCHLSRIAPEPNPEGWSLERGEPGDTNCELPTWWELTVTQPRGNLPCRHEFFLTNIQGGSQFPRKFLQLLAKGQLGLNLLEVNLLDLAQSGFKPGCETGAIRVALMDDALLSVGRGQTSILILLDFSINHEILLSCLMGGRSPG